MKKILLSLFVFVGFLTTINAQFANLTLSPMADPNSCPLITNFRVTTYQGSGLGVGGTDTGGVVTGNWIIYFNYQNVTSGNKWVSVLATCAGTQVVDPAPGGPNCFKVPQDPGTILQYVSPVFACSDLSTLVIWVRSHTGNNCGGTICQIQTSIGGSPLPVKFKSFAAARNHSVVALNWETASEQNNSGFAIERLIGAGGWQQIAFVPSQAAGGNSISDLNYQYTDLNNTSAMTQYRLKQIDFDNKSSMSDIRAVRGLGQVGKTIVYPNPTNNGRVSVVFEDVSATRDISLMDMSGRMIKQIKAVTNNNIQFDNLNPGIYSLRVVNRETGDQVVQKIVVNNR